MYKKVYLIDKYDRWCPENNDGDYFVAAFSTEELANNYVKGAKEIEGKGGCWGYSVTEFVLDSENPSGYNEQEWVEFEGDDTDEN